jgi:hypothetical protein
MTGGQRVAATAHGTNAVWRPGDRVKLALLASLPFPSGVAVIVDCFDLAGEPCLPDGDVLWYDAVAPTDDVRSCRDGNSGVVQLVRGDIVGLAS